jgi:hypothetical protein
MQITISAYSLAHAPSLPKRSRSQRLLAASCAIGISFALLGVFALSPRFSAVNLHESNHSAMQFFWVGQSSKASNPTPLTQSDTKAISQTNSDANKKPNINPIPNKAKVSAATAPSESITLSKTEMQAIHTPTKESAKEVVNSNNSASSVASETAPALSTQILGDKEALKRAYLDSRSEIQKLADNSGKSLTAPHSTKYDQFQTAASAAAKADCLGPKSGGAGLLSIPLIAIAAMTDKCK